MNLSNITARSIARIASTDPMSFEHGHAVALAYLEATAEPAIKTGQTVRVGGKPARVVSIARNGVWIVRSATDGEWARTGLDQIKERVSARSIAF